MPLRDHFHPPLLNQPFWESVHGTWIHYLMRAMNRKWLPPGYRAVRETRLNPAVAPDVGFVREPAAVSYSVDGSSDCYQAPPPEASIAGVHFPYARVLVLKDEGGFRLVGAIELVSPGNKDRPAERKGFAAKVQTYLQSGVSLVVADIVTTLGGNLHNQWAAEFGAGEAPELPEGCGIYATAYHPCVDSTGPRVELWLRPLAVGEVLPTLPLFLDHDQVVPVELESTYTDACADIRLEDADRISDAAPGYADRHSQIAAGP